MRRFCKRLKSPLPTARCTSPRRLCLGCPSSCRVPQSSVQSWEISCCGKPSKAVSATKLPSDTHLKHARHTGLVDLPKIEEEATQAREPAEQRTRCRRAPRPRSAASQPVSEVCPAIAETREHLEGVQRPLTSGWLRGKNQRTKPKRTQVSGP